MVKYHKTQLAARDQLRRLREARLAREQVKEGLRHVPSPPTAPLDSDVYLVVDDFGALGTAYLETDVNETDKKTVIADMLSGQFNKRVRVVAFNTAEGWARDVSEDIAKAVANSVRYETDLAEGTRQFVEQQLGERWNMQNYELTKTPD